MATLAQRETELMEAADTHARMKLMGTDAATLAKLKEDVLRAAVRYAAAAVRAIPRAEQ